MTATEPIYPATPTLDKMREVADTSQAIGEFLDWLTHSEGGGLTLARYVESYTEGCDHPWHNADSLPVGEFLRLGLYDLDACPACGSDDPEVRGEVTRQYIEPQLWPAREQITDLLARYFDIDQAEAEKERSAVLDYVRQVNAAGH